MIPELTQSDGRCLLDVARRAAEASLGGRPLPAEPGVGALAQPRGAFVTLRCRADAVLRGCIGYVEPELPLQETVARAAASAATSDGRFAPVTLEELPGLRIEVSALGPLGPICADEVRVGTHGLAIRFGGHAGLLLPQVAVEHRWDATTFLDQTCRKAGLPPDTWRQQGVELLAFTAVVFSED